MTARVIHQGRPQRADWPTYLGAATVLGVAACLLWLLAAVLTPQRLDPDTPADSRTGQECRSYSMDLLGGDRLVVVPTRPACWTTPAGVSR